MVEVLPKTRITVYEYKTQLNQVIGTAEEIARIIGIKEKSIFNHSEIIGYKYPEVKAVDLNTSETFYGTADEVTEFTGLTHFRITKILRHNNKSPNWKLSYTGKYVDGAYKWSKKPDEPQKSESTDSRQAVPMSDYGKELFEWSTRHLREG